MNDFSTLLALSFKAERLSARRLAARAALDQETALHTILQQVAGDIGLTALLKQRQALLDASVARIATRDAQKAAANSARIQRHDGPATAWRAWFDGSAHPNPGRCGIGALLLGPDGARIELSQAAGHGNSSEAEYRALLALLEAAVQAGARELTVYGDSQVVINDILGAEGASAPSLRALRQQACSLIAQIGTVALRWVPRHKNGAADALSQAAVRREASLTPAGST
ncbi:ribonuclease HI family protein [Massilia sp. CF038]|uniref:ribonuclease HI family protein n=1 Tax=Massilia sp. CF038 TaxID=1881045 RepID=UPI00091C3160|nr:ribonuclease HI family protein [Massilia sp. CF038]SHG99247.1 ribonuclease HI [Massilia sp. CF038]